MDSPAVSPELTREVSWRDRDEAARARTIDLTSSQSTEADEVMAPASTAAAPASSAAATSSDSVKQERFVSPPKAAKHAAGVSPSKSAKQEVESKSPPTHPAPPRFGTSGPLPSLPPSLQQQFSPQAGLDEDQRRALEVALSGRNLFLTGGAGVGKSFTLKRIVGALQQRHGINAVAVTASTGTASIHLEPHGQTLHSMTGVGVPKVHSQFGRIWAQRGAAVEDWRATRVLVVDEVSMLGSMLRQCHSSSHQPRRVDGIRSGSVLHL